ncbi:MAG: DJ-1/PfpI family protein [Phycisphaerae bacterium]
MNIYTNRLQLWGLLLSGLVAGSALAQATQPAPAVLAPLAQGFNPNEHWGTFYPLIAAGYQVDVAGVETGLVATNPEKPSERDAWANLTLAEVKPERYTGLVIAGGYSPGHLEKVPEAVALGQWFMKANKPVGAICHGPRLLIKGGLLKDRQMTGLFSMADELADAWAGREYGAYWDQPLVVDRNLVTSRYPNDAAIFAQGVLHGLARQGGLPVPDYGNVGILVVRAEWTGHQKYVLRTLAPLGIQAWGMNADDLTKLTTAVTFKADTYAYVFTVGTVDDKTQAALQPLVKANIPVQAITVKEVIPRFANGWAEVQQSANVALVQAVVGELPKPKPAPALKVVMPEIPVQIEADTPWDNNQTYDAVLAVSSGFDDLAYARAKTRLLKDGRKVVTIAPQVGAVVGLNGLKVDIKVTYADQVKLVDNAIIVAPGGLWPRWNPEARQAAQPEWVKTQEPLRTARYDWLSKQQQAGKWLVVVGMDALYLGQRTEYAGKKYATSDQAVWSFPKGAGAYSAEPVVLTQPGLVSVRGAGEVVAGLELVVKKP